MGTKLLGGIKIDLLPRVFLISEQSNWLLFYALFCDTDLLSEYMMQVDYQYADSMNKQKQQILRESALSLCTLSIDSSQVFGALLFFNYQVFNKCALHIKHSF